MAVYDAFYGFRVSPFALNPDPRFLYFSRGHREALAGLLYAISDRKGFAILSGEVGTGKTTIVHALLTQLADRARSALLFNPSVSRHDLYLHLLAEFGLPPKRSIAACIRILEEFLLQQFEAGVKVVVIIDEAHALSREILEEVRLLSNFETSQTKLLQVLLVGQPELMQRLNAPELRQLRQRLALRFELAPLQFAEAVQYVRARLGVAGVTRDLFLPNAYAVVYRFSGGMPRLINVLCDNALLTGFARDQDVVSRQFVYKAARDLGLRPLARVSLWQRLRGRHAEAALDLESDQLTGPGLESLGVIK